MHTGSGCKIDLFGKILKLTARIHIGALNLCQRVCELRDIREHSIVYCLKTAFLKEVSSYGDPLKNARNMTQKTGKAMLYYQGTSGKNITAIKQWKLDHIQNLRHL